MKKITEKIDKILTWQKDKQKHFNGAYLWSWITLIVFLFTNKTGAINTIIIGLLVAFGWEHLKDRETSFIDFMAFVVGITPVSVLILMS